MTLRDSRSARVALCVTIACLLYLPRLGTPALWEPDEGRYAEIAREMVDSGDYVTPRDDWVRYFEKPPLVYWMSAAGIRALGHNETAVRLPIALASIGQIAITQILAEFMFGPLAGAGAALCLALSPLFFGFSRFLTLDPVLALFISGSMACFYAATRKPTISAGAKWLYLAAVLAALGTLAKGPVALVLSGAVGLIYLIMEGRGRELIQVPWIGCGLITITIAAPWFAIVSWRNPGFLHFFFVHEHLLRYAVSTEHQWGPYFFVGVVVAGMWPWICFVPPAIGESLGSGHGTSGSDRAATDVGPGASSHSQGKVPDDGPERSAGGLRFALVWFAVVFLFFSIPRSKLGSYILPGFPPLAIIAGYGASRPRVDRRWGTWILGSVAAVDLAVALALPIAAPSIPEFREIPALRLDLLIGATAMALGAVAAFVVWRATGRTALAVAMVAFGMAVALGATVKAREDAAPLDSYRELARAVARELRPGCVMASYRHHVQAFPFYTRWREALVSYRGELAPWGGSGDASASFIAPDEALLSLWRSGACVILVINRSDFNAIGGKFLPAPRQIGSEGKKLAITNLPGAG